MSPHSRAFVVNVINSESNLKFAIYFVAFAIEILAYILELIKHEMLCYCKSNHISLASEKDRHFANGL